MAKLMGSNDGFFCLVDSISGRRMIGSTQTAPSRFSFEEDGRGVCTHRCECHTERTSTTMIPTYLIAELRRETRVLQNTAKVIVGFAKARAQRGQPRSG